MNNKLVGAISFLLFCVVVLFVGIYLFNKNNPVTNVKDVVMLKVDIEGEVKNPGVYEVEQGSRIEDLITKAGGFTVNADLDFVSKNINRAKVLQDQEKVIILSKIVASDDIALININSCVIEQLMLLPGIGQTTALKIFQLRPYTSILDLTTKGIVTKKVFDNIKTRITI